MQRQAIRRKRRIQVNIYIGKKNSFLFLIAADSKKRHTIGSGSDDTGDMKVARMTEATRHTSTKSEISPSDVDAEIGGS